MGYTLPEGNTDIILGVNIHRTLNTNFDEDLNYRNHGTFHVRFRTRQHMATFVSHMCRDNKCEIGPIGEEVELQYRESDDDMRIMASSGMPLRADRPRHLDEIWVVFKQSRR